MAEATVVTYTFREIATLMIKDRGIKEGLWCIHMKFGIQAGNLGPNAEDVYPTAIVPVLELGLQKAELPTSLTVDAAAVNPPARKAKKK
jgi:hypothetical protein